MAVDNSAQIAALQAQVDALTISIGSGTTSVSTEGKSASFRSISEMIQARSFLMRQIARLQGQRPAVAGKAGFSRGYTTRILGPTQS